MAGEDDQADQVLFVVLSAIRAPSTHTHTLSHIHTGYEGVHLNAHSLNTIAIGARVH